MDQKNKHLGLILILVGGALLLNHYSIISFRIWNLWPLILIYLGLKAERDYFSGLSGSRSLLTGATLTTYGVYFLASGFLSSRLSGVLWPMFILGPALGFLQMAYYGHRPKKNYRTGIILTIISMAFFFDQIAGIRFNIILYIGLIFVGFYLLKNNKKDDYDVDEYDDNVFDDDDDERY